MKYHPIVVEIKPNSDFVEVFVIQLINELLMILGRWVIINLYHEQIEVKIC